MKNALNCIIYTLAFKVYLDKIYFQDEETSRAITTPKVTPPLPSPALDSPFQDVLTPTPNPSAHQTPVCTDGTYFTFPKV